MEIKSFFYGVISVMLLFLLIASFGLAHIGSISGNVGNIQSDFGNIPENCRLPAGQDIDSWKEHLGHHSETKECLKYFK